MSFRVTGDRVIKTLGQLPGLIATRSALYTYDSLDRLATYKQGTLASGAIASPTKEANWTPDALGNWGTYLEKVSGTTTLNQTRTHNKANEITDFTNSVGTAWTDTTHDAAGNITLAPSPTAPSNSAKDQTYVWDAWNRLIEVKEGVTTLASYEYDGLNRRIRKSVGSNHYHYYYNEENQLLEEQLQVGAGTPTVRNEFVWHPQYVDALAARLDMTGGGNGVYYHTLYDANYNTTAVIDGSATVQERYHYTPYGQTVFLDSSFANPSATSTKNQENLYTSRQFDPETGLYYYRARHYHQTAGRFLGRDPLEYDGSKWNLYEYGDSNSVTNIDPNGTDAITISTRAVKIPGNIFFGHYSVEYWEDISATRCLVVRKAADSAGMKAHGYRYKSGWELLNNDDQYKLRYFNGKEKNVAISEVCNKSNGNFHIVIATKDTKKLWDKISDIAKNYPFAEQNGFNGQFKNWPNSRYEVWPLEPLANNSNTFARWLIVRAGLQMIDHEVYEHPGRKVPVPLPKPEGSLGKPIKK